MRRSKYEKPAPRAGGGLKTSAMIASLAGPDQRTKPAPFGHALVEMAKSRPDIVGLSADLAKYTDLHTSSRRPIPTGSTRWAWPNSS